MKHSKICISLVYLFISINLFAQQTITSGRLSITMQNTGDGIQVTSIKDNAIEALNVTTNLFTLYITNSSTGTDEEITASSNWNDVSITNSGASATIELSNPTIPNLPNSLTVSLSIQTNDEKSSWDIEVAGLGENCSLIDVVFPHLNIKADGNDTFFYPTYSGRLTENPGAGIDYFNDPNEENGFDNGQGIYPRGWGTTMQYFSYYNDIYGLYFGFHDPDASLKIFGITDQDGGVRVQCTNPVADKTINNNDWQMPGHFQLDLYNGDWYDAALLYKEWVSTSANYWPNESAERTLRQHEIGNIGLWVTNYIAVDGTPAQNQGYMETAISFYDFPIGWHIYEWNANQMDHFFPNYFPATSGLGDMMSNIQDNNDAYVMPYINGRIWDTGLDESGNPGADSGDTEAATYFNNEGLADAVKNTDLSYRQESGAFGGNRWATMCPTQTNWQSILVNATDELTNTLNASSVYIDMIAASPQSECFDPTHGHTLGGGSYWRDGYIDMLQDMHNAMPDDSFITVEGGCDFIADEVDGFMVQGWITKNQVPAWQVIYTGKVQLFGTITGSSNTWYGSQGFYGRLSQGFAYGVQTGRQSLFLPNSPNATPEKQMAANYTRNMGRMRYKLRNFMSYGEMKRPINITGAIPNISYEISDWGGSGTTEIITNSAIRKTVWQNENEVIVLFANGRIQSPAGTVGEEIDFSFDFDASVYGMTGDYTIQAITPTSDGTITSTTATFTQDVSLPNLGIVAYKITSTQMVDVNNDSLLTLSIYPNPATNYFTFDQDKNSVLKIELYNTLGQIVLSAKPENNNVDVSTLSKGVYMVSIYTEVNQRFIYRLIKE